MTKSVKKLIGVGVGLSAQFQVYFCADNLEIVQISHDTAGNQACFIKTPCQMKLRRYLPPELSDFLESEEAKEIGSEYSRLMEQGQMYIEAMHNSERSQKLIAAAVEDLKKRMAKRMDDRIRAL